HPFVGALSKYVPVIRGGSNGEGFTLGECGGASQFGVVAVYVGDTLNNRDRHGVALTSRSLRGHLHRSRSVHGYVPRKDSCATNRSVARRVGDGSGEGFTLGGCGGATQFGDVGGDVS